MIAYAIIAILSIVLWSTIKVNVPLPPINTKTKEAMKFIAVLIGAYFFLLIVSISFFDAYTPLDNRILSSVFVLILILIAPLLNKFIFNQKERTLVLAILGIVLISTTFYNVKTYKEYYKQGRGYNSKKWIESETIQALRNMGLKKVHTNGPDVLRFYLPESSKKIVSLPRWISPFSKQKAKEFDSNFKKVKRTVDKGKSIVVHLDKINRYYLPSKELLLHKLKEHEINHFTDGVIIQKP